MALLSSNMMVAPDHYHRQFTACMYEDFENENINHANQQHHNIKNSRMPMLIKPQGGAPPAAPLAITVPQMAAPPSFLATTPAPPHGRPRRNHLASVQHGRLHSDISSSTTIVGTEVECQATTIGEVMPSSTPIGSAKKNKMAKSNYKHVPHREKPVHLVERRNARERRRVQAVNGAFARLRKCVPLENRNKRLSKVKTLQKAIDYIYQLQQVLDDEEQEERQRYERLQTANAANLEKESGAGGDNSRWITSCMDTTNQRHSPYIGMYDTYPQFTN